jgi:predicted DsbA family dithiol-disulfide isomerase
MENAQPKRNYGPLIVLIVVLGAAAAFVVKPYDGTPKTTTSATDNLVASSLTGTKDSENSFSTFCQTPWEVAPGENTTPNVPNYGVGEHYCGNPNAKIIIVEYTDFECPYCKQFHPTLQRLVAESNGQIGWVLRHYPIDELHKRARNEALASECAAEQMGEVGFWKYADKIFEVTSSNDSLSPSLLPLIAADMGLDRNAFKACLDSGKYLAKIAAQEELANDKGPIGTPNSRIIMNGVEVEEVKGAVDFNSLKAKTDLWLKAQ